MNTAHFIFYVKDQESSTRFYESVLAIKPRLNVPGMTEFLLNDGAVLGLMPEAGIKKLLGETIKNPSEAAGIPRAELYMIVENADQFHERSLKSGATELSSMTKRSWGHIAAYSSDPDGHVLAFASDY
jgi:predicted enzyme related to lactoylglutathione lyase